ncbi:MAG: cardiolipin synthase ClsB [Rhizobacter sp.]|nr:cardiolipin synthase ClsB [Burkholderiales bacterium]
MNEYHAGNRVKLLQCGAEYFPALERAMDAAVHEIRLETYIFADDETGRFIVEAMKRAVRRGVDVRVTYDGFGSSAHVGALDKIMRQSGIDVAVFRPDAGWNRFRRSRLRRLHRKLVTVDARTAFVGGINIIDDLNMPPPKQPRFDYAVQVEGPLLAPIHDAMCELWTRLHPSDRAKSDATVSPFSPVSEVVGDHHAWFGFRDNVAHRRDIEREYLIAILAAKEEVLIANAYFFPGRQFRRALLRARRRGVRVRLLLQGRQEYLLQYYATRALYGMLLEAGVELYEYSPSFLHAKVAVIDGTWATVGSSNIDPFSLLLAREANVFVRNAAFASELRISLNRAIDTDSTVIYGQRWSGRPLLDRVLTWALYGVARGMMALLGYGRH